ncbi:MaoC family dehydratase [Polymorphum gilvum]|uniref:Dehydrogenase with MaoC-like domain n=1 Tax=Polymorphum gilvum (strain LMG 25793 / CGMCC 1.9160 / SL003B-26A1) TaxID=991905 RepID=F2J031_POLGS|nr:MaoC family dehydratase [Polymorphum gilvum]ADZ71866.1 Dehydrogenase with MaoC-like domain [Polymorphum gilvum SL003B-26A1]
MTSSPADHTSYAFEDLEIGMRAESVDTVTETMIAQFAAASGDYNPVHFDADYAAGTRFKRPIAHGLLTASLISKVMGMKLPGAGGIYVSQSFNFRAPVYPGDTVVSTATVTSLDPQRGFATISVRSEVDGRTVLDGEALVMPRRAARTAH